MNENANERYVEKYYLFVFNDDSRYEMKCGICFKDALWEMAKYTGDGSEILCKALKGFDSYDVERLVALYDRLSDRILSKVYIVEREIYERG